jgi:hypothetical protein
MTYSKGKWKFHDLGFIGTPSENLFEP